MPDFQQLIIGFILSSTVGALAWRARALSRQRGLGCRAEWRPDLRAGWPIVGFAASGFFYILQPAFAHPQTAQGRVERKIFQRQPA